MTRTLMALILCVAGLAPASAEEFTVGLWHGSAYFHEKTGEFTHCAVSAEYTTDDTLVLGITQAGSIVIGISNPRWRLKEGERYPVRLRVDRRDLGQYEAEARLDFGVYIYLPYTEDLIRLLRRGRILYFEARRETLSYKLTGTSAALPRLQECAYRELFSSRTARNPFSSGNEGTDSRNPFAGSDESLGSDENGIEKSVVRMLREAGLDGYRFVPEAYRPDYLSDAIYVWTNGTVTGATFADERGELGLGLASSLLLAGYENSCAGDFTYGARTESLFDGSEMRRVAARCAEDGADLLMSFIFLQLDELVVTVFHVADESAGAAVRDADEGMSRYFHGY